MRSWARRILLAATISMALVIFCVLRMLEILVRISFPTAIYWSSVLPGLGLFERLDRALEGRFDLVVVIPALHYAVHQIAVLRVHV